MGEKDITQKLLEEYNDVFADIVNVLLFNGKQIIHEDELSPTGSISQYKVGKTIHEQERDVPKFWKGCEFNISMLGIENETDYDRDMPLRVIGYDGAEYRRQLLKEKRFDKNKKKQQKAHRYPVVTIVLYFGINERWKNRHLLERLDVPDILEPYVSDYRINVFEIAWLEEDQIKMFKSDFRYVADFFVQLRKTGNPHLSGTEIKHVDELLKTISALTGDKRFEDEMNQEIVRKDGGIMRLEFLDRAEERGEKRGEELNKISLILRNYSNGMSPDMISDFIGDYVYVASVIETIRNLPAGCTVNDIYKEMHGVTEESLIE